MSDQNKNAQPSPFEKEPKNAGGIDDIEEGEDRFDREDRVEEDNARHAGGSRKMGKMERDEPNPSDSSDGR
jgi:hypothetical protein